jgi:pimeloyl-ACP methyl ester carboxylesterase
MRLFFALIVLLAASTAFAAPLQLAPCSIDGVRRPALCGMLHVFENRDDPARKIGLRVVVLPAQGRSQNDPIFFIAGGPGQGAAENARTVVQELSRIHFQRAIVLMDPRGTGGSHPLECPVDVLRFDEAAFTACVDKLRDSADLRYYTSLDVVEDLEDLRRALRVGKINLIAASYGTRVAAEYIQLYPQSIRAAVLRGAVAFTASSLHDTARSSAAGLERLVKQCAADARCSAAYPNLASSLRAIDHRYATTTPVVRLANPHTNKVEDVRLTFEMLHDLLYALRLDRGRRARVPMIIEDIRRNGDIAFGEWAMQILPAYDRAISAGAYHAVVCSEDDPLLRTAEREELAWLLRRSRTVDARCQEWPRRAVAPPTPLRHTGVPLLLVSGDDDDATPPSSAELLGRQMGTAFHVVMRGVPHAPMFQGCVHRLVRTFLDNGSWEGLDASCAAQLNRAPFYVPPSLQRRVVQSGRGEETHVENQW